MRISLVKKPLLLLLFLNISPMFMEAQSVPELKHLVEGLYKQDYNQEYEWNVEVEQLETKEMRNLSVFDMEKQISDLNEKDPNYKINKQNLEMQLKALKELPNKTSSKISVKAWLLSPTAWKVTSIYNTSLGPKAITYIADGEGTVLEIDEIAKTIKVSGNPLKVQSEALRGLMSAVASHRLQGVAEQALTSNPANMLGLSFTVPATELNCVVELSKSLSFISSIVDLSGSNELLMRAQQLSNDRSRVEVYFPNQKEPVESQTWNLIKKQSLKNFNAVDLDYKVEPGYAVSLTGTDGTENSFKSDTILGRRIKLDKTELPK